MEDVIKQWQESNLSNYIKKNGYILKLVEYQDNKKITNKIEIKNSDIDHIIDWLRSDDAKRHRKRLFRLSVPDAYKLSIKWTEKLNKKFKKIEEKHKDSEGIEESLSLENGFSIVKLISEFSYKKEGAEMRHCVGGHNYFENKNITIYSLRDKNNKSHCTIEFKEEEKKVNQIKGPANSEVKKKYHKYIHEFLNVLDYKEIYLYDLENIGVYNFGGYLYKEEDKEINSLKDINIDGSRIKKPFNKIKVAGDLTIINSAGVQIIADTIEIHGDLIIENIHQVLRLCNNLIVYGDLEISSCPSLTTLARDEMIIHGNAYICEMPVLCKLPKIKGELEIEDCPRINKRKLLA